MGISGRDDGPATAFAFEAVEVDIKDGSSMSMTVSSKFGPMEAFCITEW